MGVSGMIQDSPWGAQFKEDLDVGFAGASFDVVVQFGETLGDAAREREHLEAFLNAKVDALILAPLDVEGLAQPLRRYRSEGIPVVVVGEELPDPDLCRSTVIPDNRAFGRKIGEFFADVTRGRAEVLEVGGISSTSAARLRSEGFRQAIADHPGIRVVETLNGEWSYDKARSAATRSLAAHPALDGVFAHNDEMARGVWDAAREAGREEALLITGIDALKGRGLSWVMQGKLAATLMNPSPGRHAASNVLALLAGEPCLERTLLQTSIFRSNERIRAWQERKRRA